MMRLADIEEKQMTLMGEVAAFDMTYQDDLDDANTAIAAVVDDVLPDLETAATNNAAAVAELEESIDAEAANANGNKTLAEEVEDDLAKLEIFEDYYFIMDVTNMDIGD